MPASPLDADFGVSPFRPTKQPGPGASYRVAPGPAADIFTDPLGGHFH